MITNYPVPQLSEAIKLRDFSRVRDLLDPICDYDHIRSIEACVSQPLLVQSHTK